MKKVIRLLTLGILLNQAVQAQQYVSYNLYPQNTFLLNPAAAGKTGCLQAYINRQDKWTNLDNNPAASSFGASGAFAKNSGWGFALVNDKRSLLSYLNVMGTYAHHLKIDGNSNLSFGLSLGLSNSSINEDRIQTEVKNDPAFAVFNKTRFNAGFGALYNWKSFRAGFSIPLFFDQNGAFSQQFNLNAAYDYSLPGNNWALTPIVQMRNYRGVGFLTDLMLNANFKEKVNAQLGYRTDKSLIAGVGFNWRMLNLSYAYQYHTGSTYNAFSANGTQELMLSVKICKQKEEKKETPVVVETVDPNKDKVGVTVNMTDEKYGNPVPGVIQILKGNATVFSGNGDASGISNFYLKPGNYQMVVSAKGYVPQQETLDLSENSPGTSRTIQLQPVKIEKGLVFKFKTVNFETGSNKLTKASYQILDKMAEIMKENPQMVVEVAGYTDNVGDDKINLTLSEKRANAVKAYLLSKGATETQMKVVGYGEANPIASNETEEGRTLNRRVMFTVLEY